jgi:hypothetical protein
MNRFILLVALLAPAALRGQSVARIGARMRIDVQGRSALIGELVHVDGDSVSIRACSACVANVVARRLIRRIAVSHGRAQSDDRTIVLSLLGAGGGAALALRFGRCGEGPCAGALLAVPAAILGSVAGRLVGLRVKTEQWESAVLP